MKGIDETLLAVIPLFKYQMVAVKEVPVKALLF